VQLQFISLDKLKRMNDFKLKVNGIIYEINYSFFCLVSNKLKELNKGEEEFECSIPNEPLPCFHSFLDIFKGLPFYFENYSFKSLSYLINLFGLSSLFEFLCEAIPLPQNLQESLQFLSQCSCEFLPRFFSQSLNLVIQSIEQIGIEQLLCLSNFVLEQIFKSDQLQIENEDYLFSLVVRLIEKDSNRKILLNSIFFPGVSSSLLISYFKDYPIEDLDSDLFESLKQRLFCDVLLPTSLPSSTRWRKPPKLLSTKEIEDILELLHNHFPQSSNPVEQVEFLIHEKQNSKIEIEEMKRENKRLNQSLQDKDQEMKDRLQQKEKEMKDQLQQKENEMKDQLQQKENEMKDQLQQKENEMKDRL
jgi:hypothetical protein